MVSYPRPATSPSTSPWASATAASVRRHPSSLAINVAIRSSIQIALLVLPFVVILGWTIGQDCMTLLFDTFLIAVLFVAVLLVNYLIQDGKSSKFSFLYR
jgi:Ca2+:H+ antiporter